MIIMRMDRYDDEIKTKNYVEKSPLSRTERHQKMYDTAYDNRSLVDLNNYLDEDNDSDTSENEIEKTKEVITYEEKNYDINEYLKKAHERITPDLNNQDFLSGEDEIAKLIASIDEQKESDDFFGDLIGEDEDTMVEGQMIEENFTKTTYDEFYANEVLDKENDNNTKLEKALSDKTISKLELDEENTNDAFMDILKTHGISKKRKRYLAITIFSVTLFMLIIVILIIIFK